jgi:hypothetical protein
MVWNGEKVRVGDAVMIQEEPMRYRPGVVKRITKTTVLVGDELFQRKSGSGLPRDMWHGKQLHLFDDEAQAVYKKQCIANLRVNARRKIEEIIKLRRDALTQDQLDRILAILQEGTE